MRINKNKVDIPLSHDYLNFIRKNQQIIKQFQEISTCKPSATPLHRSISNVGYYAGSPDGPSIFSDSALVNRGQCRYKSMPSKPKMGVDGYGKPEFVLRRNKNYVQDVSKSTNIEKDIKNMKGQFKSGRYSHQRKASLKQACSQLKFPKISGYIDPQNPKIQIREYKSSSQTSLTVQKFLMNHKQEKRIQEIKKGETYRRSENQIRNKVNQTKVNEIHKGKLNNKLVQNYHDMQSLIEIKEKVVNFLPIFKALQPHKRQKTFQKQEDNQEELNQFLQANMVKRYAKKLSTKTKNRYRQVKQQSSTQNYKTLNPQQTSIQQQTVQKTQNQEQKSGKPQSTSLSPCKTTRNKQKRPIKFIMTNPYSEQNTVYQNKIAAYRQFLFMVNFTHRVFDPLIMVEDPEKHRAQNKYKYYIGPGNNGLLVQSLMKRRFWWVRVDDPKQANFVWTQLKLNNYFQFQTKAELQEKYDKLQSDYPNITQLKNSNRNRSDTKKQEQPRVGSILRGQLPESEKKIFTSADSHHLMKMHEKAYQQNPQLKNIQKIQSRINYFPSNFLQKRSEDLSNIRMQNHFMCNYQIGNKKALFYNLRHYYELIGVKPFTKIPLTFHIKKGLTDPEYSKFSQEYKRIKIQTEQSIKQKGSKKLRSKNIWIVKPGELSNRGNGITVINQIPQLTKILKNKQKPNQSTEKTYIVQKYIQRPFLYRNRKFDIRHYMMISRLHGRMRAYWFSQGYIRTSSYQYDLEQVSDISIHLTNDAIQKNCDQYGKYEQGNKLSYNEFQKYLDFTYPQKKYSFIQSIYPKMRQTATDAVKSTYLWMDPQQLNHNFEIFGLDFMIDANFNVWLIQVNTNPCLELSSGLLSRIIPTMIQNSLRLSIDPIFPPTAHYLNSTKYLAPDSPLERLQYQLIFDQSRDGKEIVELMEKKGKPEMGSIDQQDEVYEDDGNEIQIEGDIE